MPATRRVDFCMRRLTLTPSPTPPPLNVRLAPIHSHALSSTRALSYYRMAMLEALGYNSRSRAIEVLRQWGALAESTRYQRIIIRRSVRLHAWLCWRRGIVRIRRRADVFIVGGRLQAIAADALFASLTAPGRRCAFRTWLEYTQQTKLVRKRIQLTLAEWRPTVGPRRVWFTWAQSVRDAKAMHRAIVCLMRTEALKAMQTVMSQAVLNACCRRMHRGGQPSPQRRMSLACR